MAIWKNKDCKTVYFLLKCLTFIEKKNYVFVLMNELVFT